MTLFHCLLSPVTVKRNVQLDPQSVVEGNRVDLLVCTCAVVAASPESSRACVLALSW